MLLRSSLLLLRSRSHGGQGGANYPLSLGSPHYNLFQCAFASTKRNVSHGGKNKPQSVILAQFFFFSTLTSSLSLSLFQANELRVGSIIETDNGKGGTSLAQITKYLYTQGSGRQLGVVQATLKDLRSGTKSEARWRPGDSVLESRLTDEPATLLYREGSDSVVLMSDETFEQFSLPASMLGAAAPFLADGARVVVSRAPPELGGIALSACAEAATAEVVVLSTPPPRSGVHSSYQKVEVAGAASTSTTIKAEVAVPAHVSAGDRIVVDLRDGKFVRRV